MPAPDFVNFEYYISYRVAGTGDEGWSNPELQATVHPFTITGLENNSTYDFRVRKRRKSNGFSKYSNSLTATSSSTEESGVESVVMGAGGTFTADTLIGSISGSRNNSEIQITDGTYAGNWEYSTIEYTESGVTRKFGLVNQNNNFHNTSNGSWPTGFTADATKFDYTGSATKDFRISVLYSLPVVFTLVYKGGTSKKLVLLFPAINAQA